MKSTILRISLALVFCLEMLGTANPSALGQRDRGDREKCQKECQEKYNDKIRECNGKSRHERRECRNHAAHELRECRKKCHRR